MKQTKKHSAIESVVQTIIGLGTSILIQIIIYPLLNIPVTFEQNLIITAVLNRVDLNTKYGGNTFRISNSITLIYKL
jgi:hypothetical protein